MTPSDDNDPLVIGWDDLEEEPAPLVVDLSVEEGAAPALDQTVAPAHLQDAPDDATRPPVDLPDLELPPLSPPPEAMVVEPDAPLTVDHPPPVAPPPTAAPSDETVDVVEDLPPIPPAPAEAEAEAALPVEPEPESPAEAEAVTALPVEPTAPTAEGHGRSDPVPSLAPRPAPAPVALPAPFLAIEGPVFTAETLAEDLPAVAAQVRATGRPPVRAVVDDQGRALSHPLADVADLAVSPDGTMLAVVSCWSQVVYGLDPVADHVLGTDPELAELDLGPYGGAVAHRPQLTIAPTSGDGSPDAARPRTTAPLGVAAPAWSPDGRRIAYLEWRGPRPRHGPAWVVRELREDAPVAEAVAGVPEDRDPGALARLAYSPCGRYLLLSGASGTALFDGLETTWTPLPLCAATWAPQRGAGHLLGVAPAAAAPSLALWAFDLTTWTPEELGTVADLEPGDLHQLDLTADGTHLLGTTSQRGPVEPGVNEDAELDPALTTIVVIDLATMSVERLDGTGAGVEGVVTARRAPRWSQTTGTGGEGFALPADTQRRTVPCPPGAALDTEFLADLEALGEAFFVTAVRPDRAGWCRGEALAYLERAESLLGPRPWFAARRALLPAAGGPPPATWSPPDAETLEAAVRTGRAACALADDDIDAARSAWEATLAVDDADPEALLMVDLLDGAEEPAATPERLDRLARAALGRDPRRTQEALLRRAYTLLVAGEDVTEDLEAIVAGDDPWFAARARPIAAHAHLRVGGQARARALLVDALVGPDEEAARLAASLGQQAGWGDDAEFLTFTAALEAGPPT